MPGSGSSSASRRIAINRAPVLTLWAAVVAERLGYDRDEAVTFGKTVAGLNAATKAMRLGLAEAGTKKTPAKAPARATRAPRGQEDVTLLGRTFPALRTGEGLRALHDGKPIAPESVERYLESKFGEHLAAARRAMATLARSRGPEQLENDAYALYEAFRPEIPRGKPGWGAKGVLDLDRVIGLTKSE